MFFNPKEAVHMQIRKMSISIAFISVLLNGCANGLAGAEKSGKSGGPGGSGTPDIKAHSEIEVNFNKTSTDWVGGHSDYTSDTQPTDVVIQPHRLPGIFGGYGLYTAGTNRSDDLFIYIKKKFAGFAPDRDYSLTFTVTFLTDAPSGCVGAGGPPGEAVILKAGAAPVEPSTVAIDSQYQMNIDKGNQARGGKNAVVLGNIAGANTDCNQPRFEWKTLTSADALKARSDATGTLWMMFGIDSGFEGGSEIYYRSATITALPAGSAPRK
jgi:hypothetical protein